MSGVWVPVAARVEWLAGRRGLERPLAVVAEERRIEVTVEEASIVGPAVAGLPTRRVFVVRDGDGRRMRVTVEEGGDAAVEVDEGG